MVAAPARFADIFKANNTDGMVNGANWVGGVVPGTGDTGVFDATLSLTTRFCTGAPLSWLGMRVTTGSNTIDIDNTTVANSVGLLGGIDMSAATRDLRVASFRQQASHTWHIATGRTLTTGTNTVSLFADTNDAFAFDGSLSTSAA